ncbi:unnamed protein product [Pedinophyceae sp. YPF-701]|nr:unnamed protein product [Pedinophyceae sp. YPF-701]
MATPASSLATICWSDLWVSTVNGKGERKDILKGVSGYVEPQHMLAIMGPSGCGKTTLLDTLAGRLTGNVDVTGTMLVNGEPVSLAYGKAAYVTQDDVLMGTLTVRETMLYAARVRLPSSISSADKEKIVDEVLAELGLTEAGATWVGNWFLRGISGGQRRRVSIGVELITSPRILFLDEPTSGLDSAAAYHVMACIRRLAQKDRTILSVIHQPSSETFELFDKLLLLSAGDMVYFGDADKALASFEAAGLHMPRGMSECDFFLKSINRDFQKVVEELEGKADSSIDENIQKLKASFVKSERCATVSKKLERMKTNATVPNGGDAPRGYKPAFEGSSWLTQTLVLTQRSFVNNYRNIGIFGIRLGMYTMLCLVIGWIYFDLGDSWEDIQARAASLFFVFGFLTFMSISGFPAFIEDLKVFIRERLNGWYGVSAFVMSNTISTIPFVFGIALFPALCVYWLAGLNSDGQVFMRFVFNLFLALYTVESLMMCISLVVPHFLMGIAGGAGMLGMFMLVCGFFALRKELPLAVWRYPMHYLAFHSYSFQAAMVEEFTGGDRGGQAVWGCPCAVDPTMRATEACASCSMTGEQVLSAFQITDIGYGINVLILIVMCVVYRVGFLLLAKRAEMKRAGKSVIMSPVAAGKVAAQEP